MTDLEDVKRQIDILETGVKVVEAALSRRRDEIRNLHLRRVRLEYGAEVDALVNYKNREYRVVEVDPHWAGKPWLRGVRRNKNREWSKKVENLYGDWELLGGDAE